FTHQGKPRLGRVEGEEVVDLATAAPELPGTMAALLSAGPDALARAAEAAGPRLPLAEVQLGAPILRPPKFLAIGLNYADHIAETGMKTPEFPIFFNKQSTCVIGTGDPIHLPKVSDKLDYEGELGFVIGRRCRHVPVERASEVIAGYLIVNDVSVRDWQFRAQTMMLGKGFDTHGPMGPWLTTPDEVGDPHNLELKTWVNGELRQHSSTKHLIFNCFDQVATLSTMCTLEPGDVISTGTPSGVGIGFDPKRFLTVGDRVRIEIERLGAIENHVIEEPDSTALF
ncbi:MAG: fumarylacetoacetate hydrolase family protein, partial [Acidobacteriota bacterium]|nr:fumarylacetoacetate hydrolase family protein [Acidobacteriota bacterium]